MSIYTALTLVHCYTLFLFVCCCFLVARGELLMANGVAFTNILGAFICGVKNIIFVWEGAHKVASNHAS